MAKLTLEARKAVAEQKLKELNEAIRRKSLAEKAKGNAANRKRENRMKFLLGAFYLARWQGSGEVDRDGFGRWLTGDADRALFGLAALPPAPAVAAPHGN
jgi:hypothetical protein